MRSGIYVCGAALLICGCLGHRDVEKLVDPALRAKSTKYERSRLRGGFALGPYQVMQRRLKRWPAGDRNKAPATPDTPARPGEFIELDAEVQTGAAMWSIRCEALREPTAGSDFAAVLDEYDHTVAIDCEFWDDAGSRWAFASKGSLAANLGGSLEPQVTSVPGGALDVEVLMWRRRFDRIKRHLPHAVAQVRAGQTTVAAMVLARPEHAWVSSDASPAHRDVAMVTLAALRLLPLGFEG